MKSETVDLPALCVRAEVGTVNEEARTVDLIFSTGAAVDRMDYWSGKRYREVLSMDPKAIRLDRVNAGAPLLDSHSAFSVGDILGTVVPGSARIEKGQGVATVRFSKRDSVEPIWQDVRDGIIRSVSVGYRVHKFEEDASKDNKVPTRTAVDWEPYEISMVPMPADTGARVRTGDKFDTNPCVIVTRDVQETAMENPTPEPTPAAAQPNLDAVRTEAIAAERARVQGIHTAVRAAKLDRAFGDELVAKDITLDQARAQILDKLATQAEQTETRTASVVVMGEDAKDKWIRGAGNWLLHKAGQVALVARAEKAEPSAYDAGEFRGMTLVDLAKDCLARAGQSVRGFDKMQLIARALTLRDGAITQTTSDFATLLENLMHKTLQAQYALAPNTWSRFCAQSTVSDFRVANRYRLGLFGALDAKNEAGEFKNKAISDAEKATIQAATKGNIINVSREMIVNDDMNAFTRLPGMLGLAAALSIEVDVYALLAQNSNLGPTLNDSIVLFNASHSNISTGAALSAAAIDADRIAMASQKDPWGNTYLDLRPAVLLLPISLGGQARVINASQYDPDNVASGSKAVMKPNVVAGLFRDVVDTPRLTGTRRYLFADPAVAPVLEVAFLEGQTAPVIETKDGWRSDGAELKVRFDYGTAAVDFRGAVTNAGV
jgi:hypothetical protein